jgi:O-antigen/teichoic acid export membrane protein
MLGSNLGRIGVTTIVFGLGIALTFAAQVLLARTLTVHDYGLFSTIYSVAAIISSLGTMGFDVNALRFFPILDIGARTQFLNISIRTTLLLTLLLAALSALIGLLFRNITWTVGVLTCLGILTWAMVRLFSALSRAVGRYNLSIFIDRYCRDGALVCFGFVSFSLGHQLSLPNAIAIVFVGGIVGIAMAFPLFRPYSNPFSGTVSAQQRFWLVASLGLLAVNILELTLSRIEIILSTVLVSAEGTAIVNAVAFISNMIAIPTVAATVMVMPNVSQHYHSGDRKRLSRILSSYAIFNTLGGAVIGLAILYQISFVTGLFGTQISNGIDQSLLKIVVITKIAGLVFTPATPVILMSGKVRGLIMVYCSILLVKIIGLCLIVPIYGLAGVIYVLVGGSAALSIGQAVLLVKILRSPLYGEKV